MLNVLLVDDEKLERVLIRKGYKWEENGFKIVGEAASGKEALEYINYHEVDIVVTDINMPGMDGLQFTEALLKAHPKCRVVIITGFREFEYARKAINLGVDEFLLKPINIKEISEVMAKLKEEINQRNKEATEVAKLKESMENNYDILKESFLLRLVENRIDEEEAVKKMDTYNCKELIDGCVCIDVKIKDNQEEENYKKVYELVQNQNNDNMITFVHFMHNIIIYFVNKDLDECINYAEALHKKLNKIGITATIGISGENIGFCGIASAYGQADKALGVSVLLGRNRVVTYSEYQEVMKQNNSKIELDWDKFAEAINNCREEEMLKYIKDYIEVIKKGKIADEEYLKLMTMTIILCAGSTLNKYGINLYQLINEEDVFKDVRAIRSVTDALECAKEYIKIVYDYHNQKKSKRNKNVIEDALEYVNRNLYNSELSLKKAATDLYINESYLSREFKKTYGVSFIEYVSEKRIEASKKILKQTDLKVYEVAEKVGFKDSHYFCICFKKQTGKTVKEYRC